MPGLTGGCWGGCNDPTEMSEKPQGQRLTSGHRMTEPVAYPTVISPGLAEASALSVPGPFTTGGSSDDGTTHHLERACKTSSNAGRAWRGENNSRTSENEVRDENLVKGASS